MDEIDVLDALLAAAQDTSYSENTPKNQQRLLDTLNKPEWEKAGKVHDWRNYIPDAVRQLWDELPTLARLTAHIGAAEQAHAEEWD